MRELVAAGFVTVDRERVLRIVNGRKRVVMGRCHYFVHRSPIDPKASKRPQILLKSLSCTVQEKDPQYVSNPPFSTVPDGVRSSGTSKGCLGSACTSSSESPQPKNQIDDDEYARNHTQTREETIKEKDLQPATRAWIRSRILSRAGCHIRNAHAFLRAAIPVFLENLDCEVEEYLTLVAAACMREKLERAESISVDDVFAELREEVEKHVLPNSESFFHLAYESAVVALRLKTVENAEEPEED